LLLYNYLINFEIKIEQEENVPLDQGKDATDNDAFRSDEFAREKLNRDHDAKRRNYQILQFSLCYLSYFAVHMYRTMWSFSKVEIKADPRYGLDSHTLSNIDTTNFLVYGLTQFVAGTLGDKFCLNLVMPISYVSQAVCYFGLAMGGLFFISSTAYYYVFMIVIGIVQCVAFPAFIGCVAVWFPKRHRGLATTGFCTCVNIGNILGAQLSGWLLTFMAWGVALRHSYSPFFALGSGAGHPVQDGSQGP